MNLKIFSIKNPFRIHLLCFVFVAILVNIVALVKIPWLPVMYAGQGLSFIYILLTPGLFILPFFTQKRLPFSLGICMSIALSIFFLMFAGLGVNAILPLFGILAPLTTIPLIIVFDISIFILFILNDTFKSCFAIQVPNFSLSGWVVIVFSTILPIMSCLGAIILNNGGSNILIMLVLVFAFILTLIMLGTKDTSHESPAPILLFMIAAALLLMNSMRGWFITGHDILLEYHVFELTNTAHLWSMAFYQDPYNACLSLTIFPTYLQSLLHVTNIAYIFKFFIQFIGALPVIVVYYLTKEYVSEKTAFLAGFLYITFPTFMVDMAFLNRQGIAFLFFGLLIFTLLTTEYFSGRTRTILLFILGSGMIFSHYSTSYIAIPLLVGTYVINIVIRKIIKTKKPNWLFKMTSKLGNREMYQKPILLTLPFMIGLIVIMVLWSTVITKTSSSFLNTIEQIVVSLKHPFSLDEQTGPARYGIFGSRQPSPEVLLSQFVQQGIKQHKVIENPSNFYPLSLTESYPATPVAEILAPTTSFGGKLQSILHINLSSIFSVIKQLYAKILQVLLLIGLIGLALGYSFKKNLLRNVPVEYIALSISGVIVMVGQTILPASAIDYGLLRLFQQNLIFLALPIFLGLLTVTTLITRNHKWKMIICSGILLFFFVILSGLIPQLTGGARPLLSLSNSGLYYDSYYTHAEEVASAKWIAEYSGPRLPIQAAHFSDIKMIAYGHTGSYIELLPETTKKQAFVYLNYDNVKTSNILEIIYGDVVYYHFPMEFLNDYKSLIYSSDGSEIYR